MIERWPRKVYSSDQERDPKVDETLVLVYHAGGFFPYPKNCGIYE